MRALIACAALLGGCTNVLLLHNHPLAGRVWDVPAGRLVGADELLSRAARARLVILGEVHDNLEHHHLQRHALEALAARSAPRLLAMEQFDDEHQGALDAARARGADAEALAGAGRFDRKGWGWEMYRPLVEFALERGWPLAAANLSRHEARAIVADPARSGLPEASSELRLALERDILEGHCGERPPGQRLAGMVEAQRTRDARMARAVARQASVLIAGNGHARKDAGVPLHLKDADVVSIAMLEVQEGADSPAAYLEGFATAASFDYLWFTPRFARKDPCAGRVAVSRIDSIAKDR